MSETVFVAILGILSSAVFFWLGKRSERRQQLLLIRAQMLEPIEHWLEGVARMIGIFSDTIVTLSLSAPLPQMYDFEERRRASQFMNENTNEVLGILASNILQTRRTKVLAEKLADTISTLDNQVKFRMLREESHLLDLANQGTLTPTALSEAGTLKQQLDEYIKTAHLLIAQIKTALT